MQKIELLAPAGDLDKLKIAVLYGADAVFIGGKKFSLRARASNFEMKDIQEACIFAHEHGSKVHVTMNIIPHNEDLEGLEEYIKELDQAGVDAVIVASMYIASVVKRVAPRIEIHFSTQMSTTNSMAVNFLANEGYHRVVLAREVTLEELEQLMPKVGIDIEVFIHGGMCVSYSGRCMLSNYMTNRDANRGGCAHSCRWNYTLFTDEEEQVSPDKEFHYGSKDLMALRYIPNLIDLGVSSLKIEGRMKSIYYVATVVRSYRKLIDAYYQSKQTNETLDWDFYEREIKKAENRLTSIGFFEGKPTTNEQLYNMRNEVPTKEFVGYVKEYDTATQIATIEQRNHFLPGDTLEFFGPKLDNISYTIGEILDEEGNDLDAARHPLQILKIQVPFALHPHDMVRKVNPK